MAKPLGSTIPLGGDTVASTLRMFTGGHRARHLWLFDLRTTAASRRFEPV